MAREILGNSRLFTLLHTTGLSVDKLPTLNKLGFDAIAMQDPSQEMNDIHSFLFTPLSSLNDKFSSCSRVIWFSEKERTLHEIEKEIAKFNHLHLAHHEHLFFVPDYLTDQQILHLLQRVTTSLKWIFPYRTSIYRALKISHPEASLRPYVAYFDFKINEKGLTPFLNTLFEEYQDVKREDRCGGVMLKVDSFPTENIPFELFLFLCAHISKDTSLIQLVEDYATIHRLSDSWEFWLQLKRLSYLLFLEFFDKKENLVWMDLEKKEVMRLLKKWLKSM